MNNKTITITGPARLRLEGRKKDSAYFFKSGTHIVLRLPSRKKAYGLYEVAWEDDARREGRLVRCVREETPGAAWKEMLENLVDQAARLGRRLAA